MLYKGADTQILDVDEKGTVVFYPGRFNNTDKAGEVLMPGSTRKTVSENFKRIMHYKNHDPERMPGVLFELTEDQTGPVAKSKLLLKTQDGIETYEQYKAMAEAGKSMPHSIGYWVIKSSFDAQRGVTLLHEIQLQEVSTLTKMPANDEAVTIALKSMGIDELIKEDRYYTILLNARLKDASLEQIEATRKMVIKALDERAAQIALLDPKPQGLFARASIHSN